MEEIRSIFATTKTTTFDTPRARRRTHGKHTTHAKGGRKSLLTASTREILENPTILPGRFSYKPVRAKANVQLGPKDVSWPTPAGRPFEQLTFVVSTCRWSRPTSDSAAQVFWLLRVVLHDADVAQGLSRHCRRVNERLRGRARRHGNGRRVGVGIRGRDPRTGLLHRFVRFVADLANRTGERRKTKPLIYYFFEAGCCWGRCWLPGSVTCVVFDERAWCRAKSESRGLQFFFY